MAHERMYQKIARLEKEKAEKEKAKKEKAEKETLKRSFRN